VEEDFMRSICSRAVAGLKATAIIPRPGQAFHPQTAIRPPAKVFGRRRFLYLAAVAAALPVLPRIAGAQPYPSRPVRIIIGWAAGSAPDTIGRLMAQWLSERFGQQFVMDNRPGATGNLATEAVVRAPADGYTLLLATVGDAISATCYDKLNFNFMRDIAPVATLVRGPGVMVVNPSFPAKTIREFIAYAKANPGKINMGSAGQGSTSHLYGELFKMMTGVDMIHVPYRGQPQELADLIGGQVQVIFDPIINSIEHIRAGRLRALAVTTTNRSELLPDIPAIGEFLPGYEASAWHGIGAPRNTPTELVELLNKQINAGLADSKMKTRVAGLGYQAYATSPAEFAKFIGEETHKWAKIVKISGAKAE
jgi:tripartite-type tricarboxylate transporter receptor subunit TctC